MEDIEKIAIKIGEIVAKRASAMTFTELLEFVSHLPISSNDRREIFGYSRVNSEGADSVYVLVRATGNRG